MKLYGAEITEKYIQLPDRKKRPRYPRSSEYPYEAAYHEIWQQDPPKVTSVSRTE